MTQQLRHRKRRITYSTIAFSHIRTRIARHITRYDLPIHRPIRPVNTIVPIVPIVRRMVIRRDHTSRQVRVSLIPRVRTINRPRNRTHRTSEVHRYHRHSVLMTSTLSVLRVVVSSSIIPVLISRQPGLVTHRRAISLHPGPSSMYLYLFRS